MTVAAFDKKNIQLHLGNIHLKLCTACGAAVAVEIRMRLYGECSQKIRDHLKKLAVERKTKHHLKKIPSYNYWNCDLNLLDEAILDLFGNHLSPEKIIQIKNFRPLRNAILHGDFVTLMYALDINPTGREISRDGTRNILEKPEILESIKSIDRNGGFEKFESKAKQIIDILENLANNGVMD